jgi:hypothetical protein
VFFQYDGTSRLFEHALMANLEVTLGTNGVFQVHEAMGAEHEIPRGTVIGALLGPLIIL